MQLYRQDQAVCHEDGEPSYQAAEPGQVIYLEDGIPYRLINSSQTVGLEDWVLLSHQKYLSCF